MSLFKTRELWSAHVGENETFDLGCMCVGNIDNSSNGLDKLVVGSYSGCVRVFFPRAKDGSSFGGYKPEDCICEVQLADPVLQVEIGKFASGSEKFTLAVLHPRKLAVYSLTGSGADSGAQYQLRLIYEHSLQRTSFNFTFGPFGGVKDRDFLCVQSMDGTLSIFEQESFAFSRFLPGALIPGPLKYISSSDSFVTVSSLQQVETFRYQALAMATDTKSKEESENIKTGKRVTPEWAVNIGEQAIDIKVLSFNSSPTSIYVLGERSLYVLTDSGKIRLMKKFDFNPRCFQPYTTGKDGSVLCAVCTHSHSVIILQDTCVKWAAQLTHLPVQLHIAQFFDVKGLMVILDDVGHLDLCYLGTDPLMFMPPSAELRQIDYSRADREMEELQRTIKSQQNSALVPLPTAKQEDEVSINVDVPTTMDSPSLATETQIVDDDRIPSISVKVLVKTKAALSNVKVCVNVELPLVASEPVRLVSKLEPGQPYSASFAIYMSYPLLPTSLKGDIMVQYDNMSGAPRVVTASFRLPLRLVAKPILPVKNATFKLTVDSNKPPVNLNDIFPELLGDSAGGQGNALGFRYYGQQSIVTILASKTSQRYRLQCDDLESMWMLISELELRLGAYSRSHGQRDFRLTFEGPLPLQEYFEVIDKHLQCRIQDNSLMQLLEERANQYRVIQKRILTRFKDKTPASLQNLDALLDSSYAQIVTLTDAVESNRQVLHQRGAAVSAATHIINMLLRLLHSFNEDEASVMEMALTSLCTDTGSVGWEETVDVSLSHLLRTCLSRSAKEQPMNPGPLSMPADASKLQKHIALVCDRLSKGSRPAADDMAGKGGAQNGAKRSPSMQSSGDNGYGDDSDSMSSALDDVVTPAGTKFGKGKSKHKKKAHASDSSSGRDLAPLKKPGSFYSYGVSGETATPSSGASYLDELMSSDSLLGGSGETVDGL